MKTVLPALFMASAFWGIVLPVRAGELAERKHPAMRIFINNHTHGDTNGCSGDFGVTGQMTCGHAGHISEVAWRFLRSTRNGDIYAVTRKYPLDSKTPTTSRKEITFEGAPVLLWENEFQKISLVPKPKG